MGEKILDVRREAEQSKDDGEVGPLNEGNGKGKEQDPPELSATDS